MIFEYYLLLFLSILPLFYKYSFWFYVIQLKEYRLDRFKEYTSTKQGKSAIINIWSILEGVLFLTGFVIFFNKPFEIINYNVLFYFLVIYNLFVIGKILRKRLIKPKITGRLLILIFLFLIGGSIDLYFLAHSYEKYIYVYIPAILLFSPIIIFFYNFISQPFISHKKNQLFKKSIKKSIKINKPIKIGITGSYGKSSVKEYLSSILEQDGKTLKTPENINTELGVSEIVLNKLDQKYKYFIAEMGAYKIGEIDLLGKIVNHKYGFLTAIGNQHIALFGSQENIITGKKEIQNSVLKNNGVLYINWNDENIRKTAFDKKLNLIKYGNFRGSDAKFKIISNKSGTTQFEFEYKTYKTTFETKLLGKHNIINITGVIAFCYDLGLKTIQIKEYLKNIKSPKNTLNVIKTKKYILIDDSYNLSEDGLYAGLDVLNSFSGEKLLVMDDILELGKQAKGIHFAIGEYIARRNKVGKVLFCGVNYKENFINGLIQGGFNKKNILHNLNKIENNSIILFEGKKSNKYLNKLK